MKSKIGAPRPFLAGAGESLGGVYFDVFYPNRVRVDCHNKSIQIIASEIADVLLDAAGKLVRLSQKSMLTVEEHMNFVLD